MSLEDKIEGLTAAVLGLTAALTTTQSAPVQVANTAQPEGTTTGPAAKATVKATKVKAEPKAAEPVKVVEAEIVLKFEDVVKVLNEVAEISRDAALETLQACGVPEKDGSPKVGLLDPAQYLEVRDALQETLDRLNKVEAPASASFV